MDLEKIDRIKRLVTIALFSDDELMELLVLKGGNAIDLVHGVSSRASMDIDISLANDFPDPDIESLRVLFERLMKETLGESGYFVFDVRFSNRPENIEPELTGFWGGYQLEFKIIENEKFPEFENNLDKLRINATVVGQKNRTRFLVDFSKSEYCSPKQEAEIDGYVIYVYSPEMIVCEKLRAICQQMPEYREIVESSSKVPRTRDFYDIYCLVERFKINLQDDGNVDILKKMFEIKNVPLNLLGKIENFRGFHSAAYASLKDTLKPGTELKEFQFYFDYVLGLVGKLKSFWKI